MRTEEEVIAGKMSIRIIGIIYLPNLSGGFDRHHDRCCCFIRNVEKRYECVNPWFPGHVVRKI